jgi:uncharacterized protein (TIGR03435 family)
MTLGPWKRIGCVAFLLPAGLRAQPAAPVAPKFDVVSIRPVPPNPPPVMRDNDFTPVLPRGQYIDSRAGLPEMIAFAYDVKNSTQLVGLPNWAKNESFEVAAKPAQDFPALPPNENRQQVRLMLRSMLADRFHLELHTETRQESVYNLEVAKGGFKIKEVAAPVPPAKEGPAYAAYGDSGGRIIGNKSTLAGIATTLTIILSRPVIDQTGLKGYYDFDVKWAPLRVPDAPPPGSGFGAEGTALLISMLQDQFGLRLAKGNGPVEYWVVDHVEPPTGN